MPSENICLGHYYIYGYLQGVVNQGIDPVEVLEDANLSPSLYTDPQASINGKELQRLILSIRTRLNDHYLGFLQVPGKLAMDAEAGRAAVKSDTLGEGIRHLSAFINAVRSDEERDLINHHGADEATLVYRFEGFQPGVDSHLLYWFRMYWGLRFYCWLIGQHIKLTRVDFSSPKPPESIDYEVAFNCPVYFEQPLDCYHFDSKYLLEPIIRNEVELFSGGFFEKTPNWFSFPGRDQTLTSQVEQVIIELNRQGMASPSIEVLAGIMAMSPRTLSRKLSKEKTSFQTIKTKVRSDIATRLLTESDLPIAQIAESIGFTEPGDFTRAFITWKGVTPSSYRQAQRQERPVV